MFRWVYIDENFPRKIKDITANLNEGLQGLNFCGYLFILFAIVLFIVFIIKKRILIILFFSLLLFTYGGILINRGKLVLEKREKCYLNGSIITGIVIKQYKVFNPYALQNYYSIDVKINNEIVSLRHKSKTLWLSCPIGEEIVGLKEKGNYFFGPELGCIFKIYKRKSNKGK